MSINWASIEAKAKACMEKPKWQKQMRKRFEEILFGIYTRPGSYSLKEVGDTFVSVLRRSIETSYLYPRVEEVLLAIDVSEPKKISDGSYMITVSFSNNLERGTMSEYKKYYPINLASLYNNGADVHPQIFQRYGPKKEFLKISDTSTYPSHFAEEAIRIFENEYGSRFNLIRIDSNFSD